MKIGSKYFLFICLFFINANTASLEDSELTQRISYIIKGENSSNFLMSNKETYDFYKQERAIMWYGGMGVGSFLTILMFNTLWRYEWIRFWWENE